MTTPPRRYSNWIVWILLALILGSLWLSVSRTATRRRFTPDPAVIEEVTGASGAVDNVKTTAPLTENSGLAPQQKKITTCDQLYDCQTDRIGHESPLCPGQAICSTHKDHQYAFGLSAEGVFQWQDCFSGETIVLYNGTADAAGTTADNSSSSCELYFVMAVDASFQIYQQTARSNENDNTTTLLLWKSDCKKHVTFYPQCLAPRPVLDCPYLHLHSGGNVVLNWIDEQDGWLSRDIQRVYPGLFGN